jgi:hypothetical protein
VGQPDEVHDGLGSSELVTPYRFRSALASVGPSASSAAAVMRALALVQASFCPRTLSYAASAVWGEREGFGRRANEKQYSRQIAARVIDVWMLGAEHL